jgi:hypothetical protein
MLEYTILYIIKLFISRMGPWVFLFITFFKCQLFLFNPNRVRVHFMLVVQFLHLSSSCLLSSWLICSLIATYWCGIGYGGPCRSSEFLSTFFTGCAFLAVELWTCCMVVDFWTAAESNLFVCTCKIRFAFRTPLNQSYFYLQTVLVFFSFRPTSGSDCFIPLYAKPASVGYLYVCFSASRVMSLPFLVDLDLIIGRFFGITTSLFFCSGIPISDITLACSFCTFLEFFYDPCLYLSTHQQHCSWA